MRKKVLLFGLTGLLSLGSIFAAGCRPVEQSQTNAVKTKAAICENIDQAVSDLKNHLKQRYSKYNYDVDVSSYKKILEENCAFYKSEKPGVWEVDFKGNRRDLAEKVDNEYRKRYGDNYLKFGMGNCSGLASDWVRNEKKMNSNSKIYEGKILIPNYALVVNEYAPAEKKPQIIFEGKTVKVVTDEELSKYSEISKERVIDVR